MGRPREQNWTLMRQMRASGLSYYRIGQLLGIDHTVVMYACDPEFRERRRTVNRMRDAKPTARAGDP